MNNNYSAPCPDQDSRHLQTPSSGVVEGVGASEETNDVAQPQDRVSRIVIRPEVKPCQLPQGETGTSAQDVECVNLPDIESTLPRSHTTDCTINQDSSCDTGAKVTELQLNHHNQPVSDMPSRDMSIIDKSNHVQSGAWVKYVLGYTGWQVPIVVNGHWMYLPTYYFSVAQGLWLIWPVFMVY